MIDLRNYGNALYEQDNDVSATQAEINKWLKDPIFLEKVQKMDEISVEFRKVHDQFPYFRTITHNGKKVRFIASADGSEVYLMPIDAMSRNPEPEKYFEMTGDAIGQKALEDSRKWKEEQEAERTGERLYKEDNINYNDLAITLEGILYGGADAKELAYFLVGVRSINDAWNHDWQPFMASLNKKYKELHDEELTKELTGEFTEFEGIDSIFGPGTWVYELGSVPSNTRIDSLKNLDLGDAGKCAKIIRNVVKDKEVESLTRVDALKVATIVGYATHKQLVEIDNYLQKYYGIDLIKEVEGLDLDWFVSDDYTESVVLGKVSRIRISTHWGGTSLDESTEKKYSNKVVKYLLKYKKKKSTNTSSSDDTAGLSPQDKAGGSRY